ncbi:MAG: ATP synthase F0 subunit B [bacterium]
MIHWLLILASENPSPAEAVNDAGDWITIGSIVLLFITFLNLLKKVGFEPVGKLFAEREHAISGGIAGIEAQRAEVDRLRVDLDAKLAQIETEAAAKAAETVLEGKRQAAQVVEGARREYSDLLAKGQAELESDLVAAKDTLRRELATLALQVSRQVLRGSLDDRKATATVDRYLAEAGR